MRISVCISSRNAPDSLEKTIRGFMALQSGQHDVVYAVGIDDDDPPTAERMQKAFGGNPAVLVSPAPRPVCIGAVWNRCVKQIDADTYVILGDDVICLTKDWDAVAVALMKQYPAASAFFVSVPTSAVFPILSRAWLDAAGYVFPEYFPFWFNDTWLHELYEFTTGERWPICRNLLFGGVPGKTRNMHHLDFWWGFFNATRAQRIAEAAEIRRKLGLAPRPEMEAIIRSWDDRDRDLRTKIPIFEKENTMGEEISDRYRIARQRAEDYLREQGLKPWQRMAG